MIGDNNRKLLFSRLLSLILLMLAGFSAYYILIRHPITSDPIFFGITAIFISIKKLP